MEEKLMLKNNEIIDKRQKGNYKRVNQRAQIDKKKNAKLYNQLSNKKRKYHSAIAIKKTSKGERLAKQIPKSKYEKQEKKINKKIERRKLNRFSSKNAFKEGLSMLFESEEI